MASHRSSLRRAQPRSDRLWAPWRIGYVSQTSKTRGCLFCHKASQCPGRRNLIVQRGAAAFVLLNLFPYNNGHVMVAPFRHLREWGQLTLAERLEIIELMCQAQRHLTTLLHPDGFNIGCNIGRVAGAGVVGHLHLHLVPRWSGDTNFMPVCAGTKVISQSLSMLYEQLRAQYESADS